MPAGPTGSMRHFFKKEGRKEGKEERKKAGKIPPVGFIQSMAPHRFYSEIAT